MRTWILCHTSGFTACNTLCASCLSLPRAPGPRQPPVLLSPYFCFLTHAVLEVFLGRDLMDEFLAASHSGAEGQRGRCEGAKPAGGTPRRFCSGCQERSCPSLVVFSQMHRRSGRGGVPLPLKPGSISHWAINHCCNYF